MGTQTVSTGSSSAPEHAPAQALGGAFEDVEQVVGRIRRELQTLRTEQVAIAKRIGLIKNTIAGLAEVFGPGVVGQGLEGLLKVEPVKRRRSRGLTDACRELLRETSEPQTLKQISASVPGDDHTNDVETSCYVRRSRGDGRGSGLALLEISIPTSEMTDQEHPF